ncbi:MAG: DUF58 domain-containing protein [Meiothermus sp.]
MLRRFRRPPAGPPPGAEPPLQEGAALRIRPPAVELLRRLQFTVLRRLDGFLFGDYSGVFYGPSLDLAEVRQYQPGDEVRKIDWNVTARIGTLHVRQYREEREITAWLVVDRSASMEFGTRRVLKSELALEFAATAASIVIRHGDKVGAVGLGDGRMRVTPPRSGRQQALRILDSLMGVPSLEGRRSSLAEGLEHLSKTLRRRALVFVVSDFLDEPAGWESALHRLAQRHEVIAVRVYDPAERELPKVGELRLRDPESGEEVWLDTDDPRVRAAHAALVQKREEGLLRAFRAAQIDCLELSTAQELVQPLLKFTLRRRGRRAV